MIGSREMNTSSAGSRNGREPRAGNKTTGTLELERLRNRELVHSGAGRWNGREPEQPEGGSCSEREQGDETAGSRELVQPILSLSDIVAGESVLKHSMRGVCLLWILS